jgi:hypothetical protein
MERPHLWPAPQGRPFFVARAKFFASRRTFARHPETGLTTAISSTPAARERANIVVHGNDVLWFSPDEVATLIALDERAKKIAAVKSAFPRGRRLSDARPDRPSMGNDAAKDFSI